MRPAAICAWLVVVAGLAIWPLAEVGAAGSRSDSKAVAPGTDQSLELGEQAIEKGDFRAAVKRLERAVRLDARNADAFNLLAYSYRKLGKLDPAFENYAKALALDPAHKGAHEYLGETYLLVGEVAKAEEHLSILRQLCPDGCEESATLEQALARHNAGGDDHARLEDETW